MTNNVTAAFTINSVRGVFFIFHNNRCMEFDYEQQWAGLEVNNIGEPVMKFSKPTILQAFSDDNIEP
jgi:hypothetical protein